MAGFDFVGFVGLQSQQRHEEAVELDLTPQWFGQPGFLGLTMLWHHVVGALDTPKIRWIPSYSILPRLMGG